ncbi:nucleotide sugar dehydrogenase [Salinicoccus sp. RF5]|uniref:nucleotide sugar dehydrogenase n=1 Tax=Salinicoccus sp. RF5 TaxID=2748874 RepID=UPI001E2925F7|nr:nucleotide sugar dehydrogenase [Salinicoccus sp. RF5]MCC4722379.1 nucleotide sugar dehydrogenase [Salinicoccus sp. RF5]
MSIYDNLKNRKEKVGVIGLGYVGLPLAHAFSKSFDVIGYDIDDGKIKDYKKGIDRTNEVGNEALNNSHIQFTTEESMLGEPIFIIVTVPTPIKPDKSPDLSPIINATEMIARNMKRGAYIIYESTVYPGVTEELCIPLIEKQTGMTCGKDFFVGYSPERINPGDPVNRVENIMKIVAGTNDNVTRTIGEVYGEIIVAGIHEAPSIKVAEAAKVLENSQRDVNIGFMNEMAMILDKMNINTQDVLEAMSTKWNALGFYPGLVGGHCIGVDPYYFIYQAEQLGYHSQIISAGRKINNSVPEFIVQSLVKRMIQNNINVNNSRVLVFGLAFKENTADIRNSKVLDIIDLLNDYNINVDIIDDVVEPVTSKKFNHIDINEIQSDQYDALVYAVDHNSFKKLGDIERFIKDTGIVMDLKNRFVERANVWKL